MKSFSLLWLFTAPVMSHGAVAWTAGGNTEIGVVRAHTAGEAARHFGLADTYVKHDNGGAWCIAENISAF